MSILCNLFGHSVPSWTYGSIEHHATDGIGRNHAVVRNNCARCGNVIIVAIVHTPIEIVSYQRGPDSDQKHEANLIGALRQEIERSAISRRRNLNLTPDRLRIIESNGQAELQQLLNDYREGFK